MRLYISSYRLGNYSDKLVNLMSENKHAAIIMNAVDYKTELERKERFYQETKDLQALGIVTEEIDLRKYFGKPEDLEEKLKRFGLVWVRGGNSFLLLRAMRQSRFDMVITKLLKNDSIVYGGYSAGVVVLSPTLKGIDLVDDPHVLAAGYNQQVPYDGLNIIDFAIAPHYQSNHPESAAIDRVVEYYKKNKIKYKTLQDGEVIVIT